MILGTRHCTFLHQQIVELLSYALVLSGNHVYTSGAIGTHTAVIRGALRAENQRLLTVILPQTIDKQPEETRALLAQVEQVHSLGHNSLPLGYASRLCNSELLAKVRAAHPRPRRRAATLVGGPEAARGRSAVSRCRLARDPSPALATARSLASSSGAALPKLSPLTLTRLFRACRVLLLAIAAVRLPPGVAQAEQLIVFAFHDSHTLKEAVEEGKQRGMLVTVLWLD